MQRSTFRQPSDWHTKSGTRLCILQRPYCSCITVHKKETYLYFKDLSEGAGSLRRLRRSAGEERVAALNFWSASAPAGFTAAGRPSVDRQPTTAAPTPFWRGDRLSSSKRSPPATAVRATTRRRASPAFCPHRESAFLVSASALSVGVTPEYQVHVDFL